MRQEHETAKSFNNLKKITQAIMLKKSAQANANANAFKPEHFNLREKPSEQAFNQGLATHQEKGGSDEDE
ncbi:hypothetical protein [Helicobacter pylori]|uniref:hypothetical protein n=1 Tax=Helicobacter pylori TaxID=210 RepID=UPI0012E7AD32|nr:hypothetical protein [Helicobacter pylori]MUU26803.1 hypothetical protein [Helicobacter pylori]